MTRRMRALFPSSPCHTCLGSDGLEAVQVVTDQLGCNFLAVPGLFQIRQLHDEKPSRAASSGEAGREIFEILSHSCFWLLSDAFGQQRRTLSNRSELTTPSRPSVCLPLVTTFAEGLCVLQS